ncbi:MAG: hypothetical protein AB9Q22_01925 [Candidatus Reddybacter sp.]
MDKYDYTVQVKELIPKSGDFQYYAEVIMFRILEGEKYMPLNQNFPERKGKTKSEAESKMHVTVQKWISEN